MKSNDMIQSRDDIRFQMQSALKENNTEAFYQAFDSMLNCIADEVKQGYEEKVRELKTELNKQVLSDRGVRQLTTEERTYYQKLGEAMKSADPKQALSSLDVVMPETIINAVFDDLKSGHPLLSHVGFMPTNGITTMIMNANGEQKAIWGKLTDEILKELSSGFINVDTTLMKLSAFIPVAKSMLDIGPEWLDRYVREVLYEALANGLEAAIVTGTGKDMPIGMDRQVGDGVTVTGGIYPKKEPVSVTNFEPETVGNLVSLIATDPNGKPRAVNTLILIVNPQDYYQKVMPATTLMAPDGSYRNDVMPTPMVIIQSNSLARGEAILGMGNKYFAGAGSAVGGKIEYDDSYRFLEDERVYLIKLYANGFPKDNNAFLRLDISGVLPVTYKVTQVAPPAPSGNAALSSLSLGAAALSPEFAAETTTYSAATSNTQNTINAVPADASALLSVLLNNEEVENGSALIWKAGENTVQVTVTAENGTTLKTYTVTVTKS